MNCRNCFKFSRELLCWSRNAVNECWIWSVSAASSPWPTWRRPIEVSESTLRRDLDYWHQQGLLRRTHGGAMFVGDAATLPALEERSASQLEEKRADRPGGGRAHSAMATPILLDGGTTTLEVARLLVGRPLQIVTNSLPIANLFASQPRDRPGHARRLRLPARRAWPWGR